MNIYDNEYISLQDMFYMFTILFSPKSLRKNLPRVTSASECPLLGSTKTSPKFLNGITIENWLQGKLPFQGRSYRSSGHHQTPFHHMLRRNLAVLLQSLEAVIRAAQGNHFITCMADKLKLYIYIYLATCDVIWHLWKQETTIEVHWNVSLSVVLIKERNMLGRFSNVLLLWQERNTSDIGP